MGKGLKILFGIFVTILVVGAFSGDKETKKTVEKPEKVVEEAVQNSSWDGSISQVKTYLESHVNDPKSLEYYNWYEVSKIPGKEIYNARVDFGARNGFGGMVRSTGWFTFDIKGSIVDVVIE